MRHDIQAVWSQLQPLNCCCNLNAARDKTEINERACDSIKLYFKRAAIACQLLGDARSGRWAHGAGKQWTRGEKDLRGGKDSGLGQREEVRSLIAGGPLEMKGD